MLSYQPGIGVRYARQGKRHNLKGVGHPFPNTCMVCLADEIQRRHNPEPLQKDTNSMEKPGHSTLPVQVEWVNTVPIRFQHVEYLERIHQNRGDEAPCEVRRFP